MPRPPRIQIADGVYHVTARGNRRQDILRSPSDARYFISLLDGVARARGWRALGYCLLPNHYHLVVQTPRPDLSEGMQWINGRYAQAFNWRHGFDGHLFQGRFHSVSVESDAHLLELVRYVALNPVRAGLCSFARSWPWASYPALSGLERTPRFLAADRVLRLFGADETQARKRLELFVEEGFLSPQS